MNKKKIHEQEKGICGDISHKVVAFGGQGKKSY